MISTHTTQYDLSIGCLLIIKCICLKCVLSHSLPLPALITQNQSAFYRCSWMCCSVVNRFNVIAPDTANNHVVQIAFHAIDVGRKSSAVSCERRPSGQGFLVISTLRIFTHEAINGSAQFHSQSNHSL